MAFLLPRLQPYLTEYKQLILLRRRGRPIDMEHGWSHGLTPHPVPLQGYSTKSYLCWLPCHVHYHTVVPKVLTIGHQEASQNIQKVLDSNVHSCSCALLVNLSLSLSIVSKIEMTILESLMNGVELRILEQLINFLLWVIIRWYRKWYEYEKISELRPITFSESSASSPVWQLYPSLDGHGGLATGFFDSAKCLEFQHLQGSVMWSLNTFCPPATLKV